MLASKSGAAPRILGVAPTEGEKGVALKVGEKGVAQKVSEKGVALKVGEKAASHLTPLHAPVYNSATKKWARGRKKKPWVISN